MRGVSGSYRRYIQSACEASLVLRVREAVQQDLVMGGSIPQGEAHPQPVGVQGLHGDVGIPQTTCPGRRQAGSEESACVCPSKLPGQGRQPSYLRSHTAWSSSSWGPCSLQTQKKNETMKPLPYKVCSSSRMLTGNNLVPPGASSRVSPSQPAPERTPATGAGPAVSSLLSGKPPDSGASLWSLLRMPECWAAPAHCPHCSPPAPVLPARARRGSALHSSASQTTRTF